jgi:hypothetical protein
MKILINMKYLKTYEATLKTIQYEDMTDWGSTEPQKFIEPLDPEYFNMVFVDFIDAGSETDFYGKDEDDMDNSYWEIFIKEPEVGAYSAPLRGSRDIDNHIKTIEKLNELYLDVKSCINKVKDEYPHINVDFSIEESGVHLVFSYKINTLLKNKLKSNW